MATETTYCFVCNNSAGHIWVCSKCCHDLDFGGNPEAKRVLNIITHEPVRFSSAEPVAEHVLTEIEALDFRLTVKRVRREQGII